MMQERIESLKRVVKWGIDNKKTNIIVDLDILNIILEKEKMRLLLTKPQLEKITQLVENQINICDAIIKQNQNPEVRAKYYQELDELIPIYQELKNEGGS